MIPIKLSIDNFGSHLHSVLDFTQFDVALLVGSSNNNTDVSNGVGKSQIFKSIFWCLYGKSDFSTKEKIVKRGKNVCTVEFIFQIGEEFYRVIRKLNKKSNTADVSFAKKENNSWNVNGLTCGTATLTTKKIEEIVGINYDIGINSIYFKQNDLFGFAGSKASNRKEILKEVLQIGIWDVFQEDAKTMEKKLIDQRAALVERINKIDVPEKELQDATAHLGKISTALEEMGEAKEKLVKDHQENEILLSRIVLKAKDIEPLKIKLKSLMDGLTKLITQKDKLHHEIKSNNNQIGKTENDIKGSEETLLKCARLILKVDDKNFKKTRAVFKNLTKEDVPKAVCNPTDIKVLDEEQHNAQRELDRLEDQLSQLKMLRPGKECPTCLAEIEDLDKVLENRKKREGSLKKSITEKKEQLIAISSKLKMIQEIVNKANKAFVELERTEFVIAKLMGNVANLHRRNEEIQETLKKIIDDKTQISNEVKQLETDIEEINTTDIESIKEMSQTCHLAIRDLENQQLLFSNKQGALQAVLDNARTEKAKLDIMKEEENKLSYLIEVYRKLHKAFGKDGIQAIIMENVTEDLKNYTNSILHKICQEGMSVNFVTQKQTGTGWKEDFDIQIITKDATVDFDDLSGGEQVRISLAVRLALSQLMMNRVGSKIQFLLFDEVDQALDRAGCETLSNTIKELAKDFKILVITHNELMKDRFEHILTIQKSAEGSSLIQ